MKEYVNKIQAMKLLNAKPAIVSLNHGKNYPHTHARFTLVFTALRDSHQSRIYRHTLKDAGHAPGVQTA